MKWYWCTQNCLLLHVSFPNPALLGYWLWTIINPNWILKVLTQHMGWKKKNSMLTYSLNGWYDDRTPFVILLFSCDSDPCTLCNSIDYQETLLSSNSAPRISLILLSELVLTAFFRFSLSVPLSLALKWIPMETDPLFFSRHDWWIMLSIILDLTLYIRASHFLIWLMTPDSVLPMWALMSSACLYVLEYTCIHLILQRDVH